MQGKDPSQVTRDKRKTEQDRSLTLVNLTEDNNTRKLCLGIVWDGGVVQKHTYRYQRGSIGPNNKERTHVSALLCGNIFV